MHIELARSYDIREVCLFDQEGIICFWFVYP